jgi:hypothetical protein
MLVLLGVIGVAACSGGGSGGGSSGPATKQDAAQEAFQASTTISEVTKSLGSGAGGVGTRSLAPGDLLPQTGFSGSATVKAECPGGGSVEAQTSASVDAGGNGAGTGSLQGNAQISATFTDCKSAGGDEVTGGPLTITTSTSINGANSGPGSSSASIQSTVTYDGGVAVQSSKYAGTFTFSNFTISADVDVNSAQGGAANAQVKVTLNGSLTIGGVTYTYNNEQYSVSGGT